VTHFAKWLPAALLAALLSPAVGAQQMKIEVIPLSYRTVQDVIPVLEPLLAPGGTITGMNNQLVVKTTPQNLEEIMGVLQTIDRRLRRLMIAVRQDRGFQTAGSEQSLSGRGTPGDVTIEQDDTRRGRDGLTTTIGDEDGDYVRHRIVANEAQADDLNTFRVQGVEGQPSFIQAGTSVPIRYSTVNARPGGAIIQEGVEYHDATSGFYVVPQLHGDGVTLLVSPFMSDVLPGRVPSFSVQNVETTVTGRLGEWISLGGIDLQRRDSSRELVGTRQRSSFDDRNIQVMVTEIP
jgi:type II secretory pathway component GspD/PulD (secretin)